MNLYLFKPEIFILLWSFIVLTIGISFDKREGLLKWVSFLGFLLALIVNAFYFSLSGSGFFGMLKVTEYLRIFDLIFLFGGALTVLLFADYFTKTPVEAMFFLYTATLGMMLFSKSTDLVMVFLSLELLSFSLFYLIGLLKNWKGSQEALLKFFVLALFSSGLLLMGITIVYGKFGGTSYRIIRANLPDRLDPTLIVSISFILVGFGFKLLFVPFHLWAPDVFQGAPTPVVAFLTGAPKAAAFAALLNLLRGVLGVLSQHWLSIVITLSVLTMVAGNLAALRENNIKRMLAFSTVAHAGYILIALIPGTNFARASLLFYLVSYIFMTLGAFSSLSFMGENIELKDLRGLSHSNPKVALFLAFFFISLAGIPPTAGFIAKFQVFMAAIQKNHTWIAWFGFLNSVVAAYYYIRVVVVMYMEPEEEPKELPEFPWIYSVILVCIFFVIVLGVYPSGLMRLINSSF